jgi:site-specific recombinase XerD
MLASEFLEEHARRRAISDHTKAFYGRNLAMLLAFCRESGVRFASQLTPRVVDSYTTWLLRRKTRGRLISTHTVHKYQSTLRMFARWLCRRGHTDYDVTQELELVRYRPDASIRHLTEDELARVLAVPDVSTTSGLRNYLMIYLSAATGIRQSELRKLRRSDILDAEHMLRIRAETSKSRRERYVPLPEENRNGSLALSQELAMPLTRWLIWRHRAGLGEDDPLFATIDGQVLTRYAVASALKRTGKKAGVSLTSHALRHTAAVLLLKASSDLKLVYDILGHSSLDVTKLYLRFTPRDIQARYRQASHLRGVAVPQQIRTCLSVSAVSSDE